MYSYWQSPSSTFDTMTEQISFGGSGPALQYLHANAYTPRCYHQLMSPLSEHYCIHGYPLRPLYTDDDPSTLRDWRDIIADVIHAMDRDGHSDVIGVGHSLGAIVSWLISLERPDLFSRLVLIDPVFLPPRLLLLNRLVPYWLKKRIHPLVKITSRRRDHWDSREEASDFFLKKKIFQRWDRAAFDDFLQYGIVPDVERGGFTLAFTKEWEARVYSSVVDPWPLMSRSTVPTHILRAEHSDVLLKDNWALLQQKLPNATFHTMGSVGHLMPMEQPAEVGQLIHQHLSTFSSY